MPGLVDLHYHTAIGKGFCDHLPLLESLEEFWYPSIRALDPETAYWAALNSYAESIKNGVTTVNDMYRQLGALGRAAEEIGIRAVLSNDVALPEHNLDTLQDNQDAYRAVHGLGNGRIEVYVGIEWLPLASPELLRDARALADELGTGIHVHLNESLGEVENSKQRFGRRPTEVAYDAGLLGAGLRGRALRLAHRPRDRADARDRYAHLAQPQLQREARQRGGPAAGDAGRRDQRRARPRRGGVQQHLRPVRRDEVRLADPPRLPGGRQPAAGPGGGPDGHPQRRRGAAARHRPAGGRAGRPT